MCMCACMCLGVYYYNFWQSNMYFRLIYLMSVCIFWVIWGGRNIKRSTAQVYDALYHPEPICAVR